MSNSSSRFPEILIIGAGLSGLACARALHAAGREFAIFEASGWLGGRVATDHHEGFLFDRGFQVLLTAYPEARKQLDYPALDLKPIYPGAIVRFAGSWHRVADPFRHPVDGLRGAFNPVGTLADKLRVGRLRLRGFDFSRHGDSTSALEALQDEGFSPLMIERFFRPFLGGVFLEKDLVTTVRKMEDVLRNFARGETAIPARGMEQIPLQLASGLPRDSIHLDTRICTLEKGGVRLEDGTQISAKTVVIATDIRAAERLLGEEVSPAPVNSVACLYFDAPAPPPTGASLVLNGDGNGPVNNLIALSSVAPEYAPAGHHLISVSVVDPAAITAEDLEQKVCQQLEEWFGPAAAKWKHLRTCHIPEAVPKQVLATEDPARIRPGLYRCGDYTGVASLDTALRSGAETARLILADGAA